MKTKETSPSPSKGGRTWVDHIMKSKKRTEETKESDNIDNALDEYDSDNELDEGEGLDGNKKQVKVFTPLPIFKTLFTSEV